MNNNIYPRAYAGGGRPLPPGANINYPPRVGIPPPMNPAIYHPPVMNDDDDNDEPGPLIIHIQAPLNIKGNNNVAITDPADVTQRVSASIAAAIRQLVGDAGNGGAGVPMIDGQGTPRRIEVRVDVSTKVEGDGNLVGEKDAVEAVRTGGIRDLPERLARRREQQAQINGLDGAQVQAPAAAAAAPAGEVIVKREPLDEVIIVNSPANPAVERGGADNASANRSPNPALDGAASLATNGAQKSPVKAGSKRKSARIAHDDEVASDAGLGITTPADRNAEDFAVKRPRRG